MPTYESQKADLRKEIETAKQYQRSADAYLQRLRKTTDTQAEKTAMALSLAMMMYDEHTSLRDFIQTTGYSVRQAFARNFGKVGTSYVTPRSGNFPEDVSMSKLKTTTECDFDEVKACMVLGMELSRVANAALESLQLAYTQAVNLAEEAIEGYDRRTAVLGEREAISVLKLWLHRRHTGEKLPRYDAIAGWADNRRKACVMDNFREIAKLLRLGIKRNCRPGKGKAPSIVDGRRLLNRKNETDKHAFLDRYEAKYPVFDMLPGRRGYTSISPKRRAHILLRAMKSCDRVASRYVQKHLTNTMSGLVTILTGRPERVSGNDYKCKCLWFADNQFTEGTVLMRRNWNGAYHTVQDFTARQITRQLDLSASRSYGYRNAKDMAKRQADTLRAARSRDKVELAESYAVGNCRPGTKQFCDKLGITDTVIAGRELAKRWRAARYPDLELFSKVLLGAG